MPPPADLRNLGECLAVTLGKLRQAGVKVDIWDHADTLPINMTSYDMLLSIQPMTLCNDCVRLSPAAACLWCTPAEDEDAGGHGD